MKTDQDLGAVGARRAPVIARPGAGRPDAGQRGAGPDAGQRGAGRPGAARPATTRFPAPRTARFRMPGRGDPAPDERRLAGVCAWAGALGLGGVFVAVRLLVNLFQADGGWYRPTIILIGAAGVTATAGAFTSIHRPRLPWFMLGLGSVALVAAYLVTAAA